MPQSILFQRENRSGITEGTNIVPEGNGTVFSRLPHRDFLSSMAIAQTMPDLVLFCSIPSFKQANSRRGLSGSVHLDPSYGIALKRFQVTPSVTEEMMYKALICELLVLEHPILKRERNILELLGVAYEARRSEGETTRVVPVLITPESDLGTLADFMSTGVSFKQRIQFCTDIGKAIKALHGLNIVHGDIKPNNVLIFEDKMGLVAKVIDFGCSCFGSKDDDLVSLSRTAQWAAPEISNSHMTIQAAKLTDIYSYGMVCAWIFFGQDMPVADFVTLPSDFDQAAKRLMHIMGTEPEERPDTSLMVNTSVRCMKDFFTFSFQREPERRARDIKSLLDQLDRLSTGWNTRHESSSGIRHIFVNVFLTLSNALKLSRIELYIRASIAPIFALMLLGRKNKAFIPGKPQLVFLGCSYLYSAAMFRRLYIVKLSLFILICSILITSILMEIFGSWALALITTCTLDLYAMVVTICTGAFYIYGQIPHAIPHLPYMYCFLNLTHDLFVREHFVTELERRSRSGCIECQSDAAVQLALCYHTAFGTPRNTSASETCLKLAKKKKKHLLKLCKQVDYVYRTQSRHRGYLIFDGKVHGNFIVSHVLLPYDESSLPIIMRRLSQEIDGKRASKVGLGAIEHLSEKLGMLYHSYRDYESAEYWYRIRYNGVSARFEWSRKSHLLAEVLDDQGKEGEALDILLLDRCLRINPNGRIDRRERVQRRDTRVKIENRQFNNRAWLADLLIRQEKSNMALKLDLISDLDDVRLRLGQNSRNMFKILENILSLAQLLSRQMRTYRAADLLRKRLKAHVEIFGALHLRTMKATSDLIFILSDMEVAHVDEAIRLQPPTFDGYEEAHCEKESNEEVLLFKTAFAFALSRRRRFDEAIAEIDLILQYKKRYWTREQHVTQGCTSDLASSLLVQGEREYLTPAVMQSEMLVMAKETQSPKVKAHIIAILCALPRRGSLCEVLGMLRLLEGILEDENRDRKNRMKVRGFIVFILANLGLCFENSSQVEEALSLSIAMNEEMAETADPADMDRFHIIQLLASVYWIKSFIACQFHGFGNHDLSWMKQAEKIHREAMDKVTATFGDTHEETTHAIRKSGTLLACHGTARADLRLLNQSTVLNNRWDSVRGQNVLSELTADSEHPGYLAVEEQSARQELQSPFSDTSKNARMSLRKSLSNVLEKLRTYYTNSNERPYNCHNRVDYHPQIIRTLEALAQAYWVEGNTFQAKATSKYVLHLARRAFAGGDNHTSTIAYRILLMKPLLHDEMSQEKVGTVRELLKQCKERFGKQHTQTISCMNELALILCKVRQNTEAAQLMREALELGLTFLSVRHDTVSQSWTTFLAAMNSTTFDSAHLVSQVRAFTLDIGVPCDLNKHYLSVDDEIKRMKLGVTFLGEQHILTRSSMDSFVLLLQCHFSWDQEQAIQALQRFKDMLWSGFRPSVAAGSDNGLSETSLTNHSSMAIEV